MIAALARRLRGDRRGVTAIEFAFVSPVMLLIMMGMGDMLYHLYAQSILTGAVQKAGRDSAIQGAGTSAIDNAVISMMDTLLPTPSQSCPSTTATTWCSTRYNYDNFTQVAYEPFTDTNSDGRCDNGEPFYDMNGNGVWNANPPGASGQGGANDVTLYTMTITYNRVFPVTSIIGLPATQTISASTLLKNQPYATQLVTTYPQRNCP